MTKEQLIELCQRKLEKLPEVNIAHEVTVELLITMAFKEIMFATFKRNKNDLDLYSFPYEVTITGSKATLPVVCYQLPQNAQIRSVHPTDDSSTIIVPVSQGADTLYQNLDVGLVDTTPSYKLSGNTVYFYDLNEQTDSLTMWLVTSFESLDYDAEVHIPSGKDIDFMSVFVQLAMGELPNLVNNG